MYKVESRLQVNRYHGIPLGLSHTEHEAVLGNTGVVHKYVYGSKILFYLGHYLLRLCKISRVGSISLALYSESLYFIFGSFAVFIYNQVGKRDISALLGKFHGQCLAYAACGTSYERRLSFKKFHILIFSSLG